MARKLLFLLLSSFLFTGQAAATMSSSIVWEFQADATASMVNGGGFKTGASGVDHSTDNAAVTAWSKTDGTSNASTTFTSAAATFDANIVGNVLHLISGTNGTVGWYEVTAYTDANTITLDRNCSTGAMTNGVFNVGGALDVGGTLEDDFFEEISGANSTDGMKVWIQAGNYTLSEAISMSGSGGSQNPIVVEGYNATRGDTPTGTDRPWIIQGATSFLGGSNVNFYNFYHTGSTDSMFTLGSNSLASNCKFVNTSSTTGRSAFVGNNDSVILNSEAVSLWGRAIKASSAGNLILNNYVHDSDVGVGHGFTSGLTIIDGNIIADNVTAAIQYTGAMVNVVFGKNNTLYGAENTVGIGVSLATGTVDDYLFNNIIYGFVTGVSHADATQTVGFDDYNAYNNNDTDVTNWTKGANDSTAAPGFTNVTQVTGTTGAFVAGGSKLVDTSKNFTTLGVAADDIVYITGGTGTTTRKYVINSISTTTNPNDTLNITVPASPGTDTTANKTYQITLGHDFSIGTNLKALGFPGAFQGATTTGYMDIGGAQRQEAGAATTDVFGMIQ